jgi:hypothetical protein
MHSNFITPPDYVETVLIIGATDLETAQCAEVCKTANTSYDVYFYRPAMAQKEWLSRVYLKADIVLSPQDLALDFLEDSAFITDQGNKIHFFGTKQKIVTPADYFNK